MRFRIIVNSALSFMLGIVFSQMILNPAAPKQGQQSPPSLRVSATKPEKIIENPLRGRPSADRDSRGLGSGPDNTNIVSRSPESAPFSLPGQPRSRPARSMHSHGEATDQTREQRRASKQLDRLMESIASYTKQNTESAPSYDTRTIEARTRWSRFTHEDRQFLIAEGLREYDQASEGEVYE